MTVGELRAALAAYPDEMPVGIHVDTPEHRFVSAQTVQRVRISDPECEVEAVFVSTLPDDREVFR